MSEPLARLYDLALRTLDDQERRADALRGRLGPTLAAAALGVALLSGPVVVGTHPATILGKLALISAVAGLLLTVGSTFYVLLARRRSDFHLDPRELLDELSRDSVLNDAAQFYTVMITRLDDTQRHDVEKTGQLTSAFTAMLCGILMMLCGLAIAALVG